MWWAVIYVRAFTYVRNVIHVRTYYCAVHMHKRESRALGVLHYTEELSLHKKAGVLGSHGGQGLYGDRQRDGGRAVYMLTLT